MEYAAIWLLHDNSLVRSVSTGNHVDYKFEFERVAVVVATASAITLNWDEAELAQIFP